MQPDRKVILFETNEIPFRVIDHYAEHNPRSKVARVLSTCKQFHTVCEDQVELDPWISWPTLHRGVIDAQHGILHLGQSLEDANNVYPPIWELLARQGVRVGVMGSLHSSTPPTDMTNYAFYIPDFFADRAFAHPKEVQAFQAFNLAMTRLSARNVATVIPLKETFRFLLSYVRHGVRWSTVAAATTELATEFYRPHLKCRRRAIQPLITLDIFLHLMHRTTPGFATLHTNHVAAAMHRYWAAAFPDDLSDNPMPVAWRRKYKDEVTYAMSIFELMLGRLVDFVGRHPSYLLVVASSMGQAPIRSHVTKGFYTITNLKRFLEKLGVADGEWKQRFAMVPCISVIVDPKKADLLESNLGRISVGDKRVVSSKREVSPMSFDRNGQSFQLFMYFERYTGDKIVRLGEREMLFEDLGLGFYEHQDDVCCSARHTPDGILLVYDPTRRARTRRRERISTLDVAPAILQLLGIQPRTYMNPADAGVLDVEAENTAINVMAYGGGVEKPVTRSGSSSQVSGQSATIN